MAKLADYERYMKYLCEALGHRDRHVGFSDYSRGLMLPIERKSVEPLAAHIDPGHVSSKHQSLHHLVADSEWSDAAVLGRVRDWGADPAELGMEFPGDAVARAARERNGALPSGKRTADVYDFDAIDRSDVGGYPTAHLFGKRVRMSGATDYLRTQALSRLFLDNVYSIGASWVTMGPHVGQVALAYGANDMGSVMMEENVVSSAGTTYCLDEPVLCRLIREAGFTPAQRNNTYEVVRAHPATPRRDAPDLAVTDWSTHRAKRTHQQAPRAVNTQLTVAAAR